MNHLQTVSASLHVALATVAAGVSARTLRGGCGHDELPWS